MSQIEITTLGKSCEFFNGKAHEKSIDENGKYIVVNSKFISQEGRVIKRTNAQMYPLYKGDIVMVMSDVPNGKALAKCFIIDKNDNYSLNQRICCIRSKEFDNKYLYYQLNRHEHFLAFNNGENQTNLRKDDILDCPLIKPSLEEQKRMVEELDDTFLKLEIAIKNLQTNYNNSDEIFDAFCHKSLWEDLSNRPHKLLSEIVDNKKGGIKIGPFGSALKIGELVEKVDVRVLYIENIVNNSFDWHKEKYITKEKFSELKNYEVFSGDVLITIMGTIGRTAVVPENLGTAIISSHLIKITPNKDLVSPEYLNYSLNRNPFVVEQLFGQAKGAIMKGINSTIVKSLVIPLPSLEEQKLIVSNLNILFKETEKLKTIYSDKLNNISLIKGSILTRAFENEFIEAE